MWYEVGQVITELLNMWYEEGQVITELLNMWYEVGQVITELLNTRNWKAGARYRSEWRKKAGYSMARKQFEKP